MVIRDILYFLGASLCHQNAYRSFAPNGLAMPVCSRCTGIYIAFLLSLIVMVVLDRRAKINLPPKKILWGMLAVLLVMGADVAVSTLQIYDSGNIIRFFTGFMFGWSLPLVLLPLKNLLLFRTGVNSYYLKSKTRWAAWASLGVLFMAAFYFSRAPLFWLWSTLSVLGLVVFAALLLVLLISLFPNCGGRVTRGWMQAGAYLAGFIASLLILSGLSALRIYWF
ncbi:MAG: DUF2085 domain-containing protein [Actinomycetia bacterium]|nr:DUF2085 domain-containing protein [Actinomycetes bacterium]